MDDLKYIKISNINLFDGYSFGDFIEEIERSLRLCSMKFELGVFAKEIYLFIHHANDSPLYVLFNMKNGNFDKYQYEFDLIVCENDKIKIQDMIKKLKYISESKQALFDRSRLERKETKAKMFNFLVENNMNFLYQPHVIWSLSKNLFKFERFFFEIHSECMLFLLTFGELFSTGEKQ